MSWTTDRPTKPGPYYRSVPDGVQPVWLDAAGFTTDAGGRSFRPRGGKWHPYQPEPPAPPVELSDDERRIVAWVRGDADTYANEDLRELARELASAIEAGERRGAIRAWVPKVGDAVVATEAAIGVDPFVGDMRPYIGRVGEVSHASDTIGIRYGVADDWYWPACAVRPATDDEIADTAGRES